MNMKMNPTWYQSFFSGVIVDMWRDAASPEQTRLEVDFLEKNLQLQPGQPILDVPCGFGRHSLELTRRGYRMTGVDVSTEMLDVAKSLATEAKADIRWRAAEMRDLAWQSEFHAAFCFGNSFGYLNRNGTRNFLSAISHALKKGARFAFDYGMTAESILPRFTEREWTPVGDLYFLEHNHYHIAESCIETTYTIIRKGSIETRTGFHWVYTVNEIQSMLQEAGLATRSLFASCASQPFEVGSPLLIVVAEKQ